MDTLLQCFSKRYDKSSTTEIEQQTESSDEDGPMLTNLMKRKRGDPDSESPTEQRSRDIVRTRSNNNFAVSSHQLQLQVRSIILLRAY